MAREPCDDRVCGFLLSRQQLSFGSFGVVLLDDSVKVLAEVDLRDAGLQSVDLPLGGWSPAAGSHHPAVDEDGCPVLCELRGGEERVDVAFCDDVLVVVALRLDRDQVTV